MRGRSEISIFPGTRKPEGGASSFGGCCRLGGCQFVATLRHLRMASENGLHKVCRFRTLGWPLKPSGSCCAKLTGQPTRTAGGHHGRIETCRRRSRHRSREARCARSPPSSCSETRHISVSLFLDHAFLKYSTVFDYGMDTPTGGRFIYRHGDTCATIPLKMTWSSWESLSIGTICVYGGKGCLEERNTRLFTTAVAIIRNCEAACFHNPLQSPTC